MSYISQLVKFGLEHSQEPVIKNPVLRAALEEPRTMAQAPIAEDLEPGALRDEMLKDFDPSQETHEEYLQRINLERPFNMAEGGQLVAPSLDGSRPGYARGPKKKPITFFSKDVQKLIKGHGVKKYNELSINQQYRVRQGENVGTGSGRVLGDPITIDGIEYKKVLEGPDKGKYAIKQGTNNPRQFVKKSEIRKTVKSNFEKGQEHLAEMYEERSRLHKLSTNNRNNWIKNWIKNNINEYGVREFDKFQNDLLNDFNKELKNNPKKYPEWQGTVRVSDNLPIIGDIYGKNTIAIDGIKFPRYERSGGRTQKHAYKKLFYKNKLKDKNFKAKVNAYLDWNLTRKFEGGAGSMTKTAALDYGKLAKGFDEDVVHFMGEVLNERPLNPGGGQKGIHDIFRDALGKKANAYFKKYHGSWGRWVNNFYDVAKLAGLNETQAKALLQKQINDTQKIMKVYNVKKLPLEFMVAQDHIMGLAEAKALGDPKIAAQTLRNLVASTREQNRYLGQEGFSTKRKALIKKFKAAPKNARGPIVAELNTLTEEFVPGRLKYDVRKDGSLKITNLQPETTLKAKSKAYSEITKTFPKNIQNLLITLGCGNKKKMSVGGRVGFAEGSGCMKRAYNKLKSGKFNSAEKKIVDDVAEGLKQMGGKGGLPKKFWTTAIKGEGYFALADFVNNLTKGQSLGKSFSNALHMATFGGLDIGGNERDLMKYAKERGLDTKAIKEWMDYAETYGKYAKTYEDVDWAEKQIQEDVISPDDEMMHVSTIERAPGRIEDLEGQLEEKGKSETIQSGKGYKDMNEAIEGVIAKEWNKPAGTVLDRGLRKMLGMKGDEGLVWGPIGNLFREGIESLGFGEHKALKGFTPQTVMNYHPVYGYKEDIKDVIRGGDSPMEDMLYFMNKYYPNSGLLQEALRTKKEDLKKKKKLVDTGWGMKEKEVEKDMGTYDYNPNMAGGGIAGIRRPNAIPPESGPTPYGLPSMLNRVRRI